MRKLTPLLFAFTAVAGCSSGPTAPDRNTSEPPRARFDGGFLGGSGNRAGDSINTTTGAPQGAGFAETVQAVGTGAFLGGSGN
jgi:hypothetical protein